MDEEETASETLSDPYFQAEDASGSQDVCSSKDNNTLPMTYNNTARKDDSKNNKSSPLSYSVKEEGETKQENKNNTIEENLEWVDFDGAVIFDDCTEDEDDIDVVLPLPVTSKIDIEANMDDSTVLGWLFSDEKEDTSTSAADDNSVWMHTRLGGKSDASLLGNTAIRDDVSQITCDFVNPAGRKKKRLGDSQTSDTSLNNNRHRKTSSSMYWAPAWIKCLILVLIMVFCASILVLGVALLLQDYSNSKKTAYMNDEMDEDIFISSLKTPSPITSTLFNPPATSITKDQSYSPILISLSTNPPSSPKPSSIPTYFPSFVPTLRESSTPTAIPSANPTNGPSSHPSNQPSSSTLPSVVPTPAEYIPCPQIPKNGCSVCGLGRCITSPDTIVTFRPGPSFSCADIEALGLNGELTNRECTLLKSYISKPCQCEVEILNESQNPTAEISLPPSALPSLASLSPTITPMPSKPPQAQPIILALIGAPTSEPTFLSPVLEEEVPLSNPVLNDTKEPNDNSPAAVASPFEQNGSRVPPPIKKPDCIPAEDIDDDVFANANTKCQNKTDCGKEVDCLVFNDSFAACDTNNFFSAAYPAICSDDDLEDKWW